MQGCGSGAAASFSAFWAPSSAFNDNFPGAAPMYYSHVHNLKNFAWKNEDWVFTILTAVVAIRLDSQGLLRSSALLNERLRSSFQIGYAKKSAWRNLRKKDENLTILGVAQETPVLILDFGSWCLILECRSHSVWDPKPKSAPFFRISVPSSVRSSS